MIIIIIIVSTNETLLCLIGAVVAELIHPCICHLELPRALEGSSQTVDCLPIPGARSSIALKSGAATGQFIVGSDDGSVHTVKLPSFKYSIIIKLSFFHTTY